MKQNDSIIEATNLNLKEVGNRIKLVRTQLLNISQEEFANVLNETQNLNTTQTLISRIEKEGRCSAELFLAIINYINSLNYRGYILLAPTFDLESVKHNIPLNIEQIVELVKLSLKQTTKNLDEVIQRLDLV